MLLSPHPGLFLTHGRPIDGIAIRSNVLDLESDDIAASMGRLPTYTATTA
jgi:hypothetical protein